MSGKKKSLLNRVLGKNKDGDEDGGGKGKKGKKGKLAKEPSMRESVHSVHAPTMHSVPSEPPIQYGDEEDDFRAPVTAVHEENPYSLYRGDSMREPSAIHVRPPSHAHPDGDFFQQPIHDSPRASTIHTAGLHEAPFEHAETARHSNVIALGQPGFGHAGFSHAGFSHAGSGEHVAVAGVSRQPTVLAPGQNEAPRMLKPGDSMEIDPLNPPTFVIDEGVTLEIGDEETGFIPYEEYLAKLSKQPPPKTGGTYIVQGGGDVVIQDENGKVIRQIPGTGAMAGRGPPQIHEPPHLIPIFVPVKSKPRQRKTEQSAPIKRPRYNSKARSISSVLTFRKPAPVLQPGTLEILREPIPSEESPFPSIYQVITPSLPSAEEEPSEKPRVDSLEDEQTTSDPKPDGHVQEPIQDCSHTPRVTESSPIVAKIEEELKEYLQPQARRPQSFVEKASVLGDMEPIQTMIQEDVHENEYHDHPHVPMRPIPSPPPVTDVSVSDVSSTQPFGRLVAREDSAMSLTEAPLASPASFEEFDSLEDADSDLALFTKPNLQITSALAASFAHPLARKDSPPPVTPIEELSDLSEVILSPTFRELESISRASMMWSHHKRTPSNASASQGVYPSPRVSSHTPTTEPLMQTLIATSIPTPPASRRPSPTLTHSSEAVEAPVALPSPKPSSPPPRPVRSPCRPSLTSRNNTPAQTLPPVQSYPSAQSFPAPPPMAIQRQTRSSTMPIPIPQPERPKQPRINPSPKIMALMQQFEGVPREYDDSASISSSRRGSGSSSMLQRMEPWSQSPPSSRPGTPNSLSEFGERLLVEREPVTLSREEAASLANGSSKWHLKQTAAQRDNYTSHSAPRSTMTPAIPGFNVQPSLLREWSLKRPKRMD